MIENSSIPRTSRAPRLRKGDTVPNARQASIPNPNHFSKVDARVDGGAVVINVRVDIASCVPGARLGGANVQPASGGTPEQVSVTVASHGDGLGWITTV